MEKNKALAAYTSYRMLRVAVAGAILAPMLVSAQAPSTFREVVGLFVGVIADLIPLVAAIFVFLMFWGLAKFMANAGDTKAHETGRFLMFWGTIGLFIMATLYGILAFLMSEFGFGALGPVRLPT